MNFNQLKIENPVKMLKVFAVVLGLVACVAAREIPENFVSGDPTEPFAHPFAVSIQAYRRPNWVQICGGALIRANWILTGDWPVPRISTEFGYILYSWLLNSSGRLFALGVPSPLRKV